MHTCIMYHAYMYNVLCIHTFKNPIRNRGIWESKATTIRRVQTQQNRVLKILYNKEYFTPTKHLHKELNLLMVRDIFKHSVAKYMYKQNNGLLPEIFENLFTENNQIHYYTTRQNKSIYVRHSENKYSKMTTEQ